MHLTYYELFQKLNFPKVELINYNYIRLLFEDSALAQAFISEFGEISEKIEKSADIQLEAKQVGKNNSAVIIEGLCALLERSPDTFETVKALIRKFLADEKQVEGTAKEVLKITRKQDSAQKTAGATPPTVTKPKAPAPTPSPKTRDKEKKGNKYGLTHEGDRESYISSYMTTEEVDTCAAIVHHITEKFNIKEEDARAVLDAWIARNKDKLEYDPKYDNGSGLVKLKD